MLTSITQWLKQSFGYLWLIVLAVYFSVLAGQAFYRNYQAQQDVKQLDKQLAEAKIERERLSALVVYYHSPEYQELELRRSLLLKQPNETAYALPEWSHTETAPESAPSTVQTQEGHSTDPNWKQWLNYVLGRTS